MKAVVDRDALLGALDRAQGVAARKSTIPILSHFLVSAQRGSLSIVATDLAMQITAACPAETSAKGSAAAPAAIVRDVVRTLPSGGQVEMESTTAGRLALRCGRASTEVPTLPVDDFPVFPTDAFEHEGDMPGAVLAALVDRPRFAVLPPEDLRSHRALLLELVDGPKLRAVGTNGRQLVHVEAVAPEGLAGLSQTMLSPRLAAEVQRLAVGCETVALAIGRTLLAVRADGAELVGKLDEPGYPDYRRVIPADIERRGELDGTALVPALRRAALVAEEKYRAVRLDFEPGAVALAARSWDRGAAEETVSVIYDGEPFTVSFNAKDLAELIEAAGGGRLEFGFSAALDRVVFTVKDRPGDLFMLAGLKGGGN